VPSGERAQDARGAFPKAARAAPQADGAQFSPLRGTVLVLVLVLVLMLMLMRSESGPPRRPNAEGVDRIVFCSSQFGSKPSKVSTMRLADRTPG